MLIKKKKTSLVSAMFSCWTIQSHILAMAFSFSLQRVLHGGIHFETLTIIRWEFIIRRRWGVIQEIV